MTGNTSGRNQPRQSFWIREKESCKGLGSVTLTAMRLFKTTSGLAAKGVWKNIVSFFSLLLNVVTGSEV
jgi:hypothetical protein